MKKRSVLSFIAVMIMSAAISGCSTSAATDGKVNAEAADSETMEQQEQRQIPGNMHM